ncbi:hypothetical protein AVEN_267532-1 [Araneus ventricosus]|uniref:Neurotransmitter-gated ion-channel transmembrane domain-containing protein n=1 Tax=Araneus ventricosus TaxID=182803 RepID=A0A4Y2TZ08_ARAVE|nr:hypothetical protein AVEN_267532-1 [Araneus ventricosus]
MISFEQVTLSAERADLSNFHPNPEFHLEDVLLSPGGGKALAFSMIVRRRPGPPLLRHVLPCFLVTGLAALTFLVPPTSGERVSLAIGCLLALLLVSVATGGGPRASAPQLPLLGMRFLSNIYHHVFGTTWPYLAPLRPKARLNLKPCSHGH